MNSFVSVISSARQTVHSRPSMTFKRSDPPSDNYRSAWQDADQTNLPRTASDTVCLFRGFKVYPQPGFDRTLLSSSAAAASSSFFCFLFFLPLPCPNAAAEPSPFPVRGLRSSLSGLMGVISYVMS